MMFSIIISLRKNRKRAEFEDPDNEQRADSEIEKMKDYIPMNKDITSSCLQT